MNIFYNDKSMIFRLSFSSVSLYVFNFLQTCLSLPTLYYRVRYLFCSPDLGILLLMTYCHFLTLGNPNLVHSVFQSLLPFQFFISGNCSNQPPAVQVRTLGSSLNPPHLLPQIQCKSCYFHLLNIS